VSRESHQRSGGEARKVPAGVPKSAGPSNRRATARPGPGRPTAARVEAINRAILIAARAELVSSGYESARMEAVAAAASVSKGTLYSRYPTKEALLRGVIADNVAAWSGRWDSGGPPMDLRQRLKHQSRSLMAYCCSGKLEQLERLIASVPPMHELRRLRHEFGHERTVQVMAQGIIDETRDQSIQARAAVRLAEMLIAMLYGWWRAQREIRRVEREEALAYADHAVDVLFEGRSAWAAKLTAPR
jgi:TetR/AcrR family transcriptional repressor of mexJK operon